MTSSRRKKCGRPRTRPVKRKRPKLPRKVWVQVDMRNIRSYSWHQLRSPAPLVLFLGLVQLSQARRRENRKWLQPFEVTLQEMAFVSNMPPGTVLTSLDFLIERGFITILQRGRGYNQPYVFQIMTFDMRRNRNWTDTRNEKPSVPPREVHEGLVTSPRPEEEGGEPLHSPPSNLKSVEERN